MKEYKLINGDCLQEIKKLAENTIDAIVTDPPYELGFMGKKWDNTGIAYNVELWRECLRVLKPGGHLLAFGGTRTYHRMAVAIEDAGFEIRDMIEWIYASGFPKSLNIGKAVDKLQGNERKEYNPGGRYNYSFQEGNSQFVSETATKNGKRISILPTKGTSQWEGFGTALKPAHENIILAQKSFQHCSIFEKELVSLLQILKIELCQLQLFAQIVQKSLELNQQEQHEELNIVQCNAKENTDIKEGLSELMDMLQSVLTENTNLNIVLLWLKTLEDLCDLMSIYTIETKISLTTELKILNSLEWGNILQNIIHQNDKTKDGLSVNVCIAEVIFTGVQLKLNDIRTAFATEIAILRENQNPSAPKHEPIVMARKPLSENTIVENVLKHGTGAIDIEGCRIPYMSDNDWKNTFRPSEEVYKNCWIKTNNISRRDIITKEGRFPANIIVSDDALNDGVMTKTHGGGNSTYGGSFGNSKEVSDKTSMVRFANDSGSKSRYFDIDVWAEKYGLLQFPKASKSERNAGCEGLEEKHPNEITGRKIGSAGALNSGYAGMTETPRKNIHPTIKPVRLMAYLVRLISKEGDTVLDPFTGSGTTGVACAKLNRQFIGIEQNSEYIQIATARIEHANKNNIKINKSEIPEATKQTNIINKQLKLTI